jgi:hypothetical protein
MTGSRFGHGLWKVVGLALAGEKKVPVKTRMEESKKNKKLFSRA